LFTVDHVISAIVNNVQSRFIQMTQKNNIGQLFCLTICASMNWIKNELNFSLQCFYLTIASACNVLTSISCRNSTVSPSSI